MAMTPERWQQIKAVLEEALERDPPERESYLEEVCAGDSALRAEVEALIESHTRSGDFIESPAYEVLAGSLTQTELVPGTGIGPHEIIRRLGAGGMGDIYLAEDTRLGRKVALKVLPTHFTKDAERVRRFQLEAKAASALSHPNIITIYEIGRLDELHYIVFEFIDGQTLRQRIATAPLTITEALHIAGSVAAALLAAHEAGIVHRDVKPDNIMIRADNFVKVLDFGLAKLTERKAVVSEAPTLFQTEPGIVMGTTPYLSPEQARGLEVDARTDIWSLGVVLYEMLAGRPPFEGPTNSDVLVAILEREPVPLPRYRPEVPTELEWILKKALRKDRDERYQTTRELLADLKHLAQRLDFEQELKRSRDTGDSRNPAYVVPQSQPKSSSTVIDSLAIVPFHHDDPDAEYLSDGIAETMITTLSRLPELRVMAWSTVSQYKGQQVDPRRVGRELGVRAVVTGRIVQATDGHVMKLELVDADDGSQLWAEHCICNPGNVLDVGTQVSCELSEQLLLRLTNEERTQLARHPTDNVEAYHSYLKGRYCWNKRTDEDVRNAIEYFKKAIDSDPTYALAYIGLADCYLILGSFGVGTLAPKDAFPRAREALERAIEIDDTLAEAHASLGYCLANYDWNWAAAEREFNRALELEPGYAVAHHWYGFVFLTPFGRLDEALAELRQALNLDPLSLSIGSNIGLLLYLARRYDDALFHFQRHLEMDRTFVYTHWEMGLSYEACGRYDEAIAAFRKAISLSGTGTLPRTLLARTYALAGRKGEALNLIDELNELSVQHYVSPYRVAAVYAALGARERAFKWLEHAFEARDGWLIWLAVDPVLDSLRSDERFNGLLRKIGLPATTEQPHRRTGPIASTQVKTQSFVGRFPRVAVVLVLVLVALAAAYLLLKLFNAKRTAHGPQPVSFQQLTYHSGPEFFPSLSPDGKSIVYASRASGNWDIYFQRIGDANLVNLTRNFAADDSQPAFSPDGQRIAFRSERDGGGVYVMSATGDSPVRVSDFGYSPSWSPEGGLIVVGTEKIPQPSTRPTKSQLWTIDLKSGQRQRISEGDALQPTFSPQHKRIAYWSRPDRYGQREHIWTIPVGGGEPVAVTDGSSTDLNPVWSPDGEYLYFSSNRGGSSNIWRVLIDESTGIVAGAPEAVTSIGAATAVLYLSFSQTGQLAYSAQTDIRNLRSVSFDPRLGITSKPVVVTEGSLQLWFPDVSPDGEWLTAYSMGEQRHIYVMRTDGTNQRDLTPDTYRHAWPRWSPDGQRIAFTSRRTGEYELWVMNRDGSNLHQVSQSHGGHYSPWSVDGSMIAYSIHTPRNDCVIINPDKPWGDQKFLYLSPLSDASLSFEGWSWSTDGKKLTGIRHLPNGVHSGIGIYDLEARTYDWLTDFGDWPVWLKDDRHLLFVSQGSIYLFDTASRKYDRVFEVTDQDVDIGSPALSRDNRRLYFTYVAAEADIWLMNLAPKSE